MEQVVTNYLKLLNIPVSESYCKKRVASHPDYTVENHITAIGKKLNLCGRGKVRKWLNEEIME